MEKLDIDKRWPELFYGLTPSQKFNVMNTFASSWHEGWEPNYDDVKTITSVARGELTLADVLTSVKNFKRNKVFAR
ncbi:antitoxin VbhA family protein [Actinotignum urinale]|uniref:Antitoxin VbhA family protein n=1 Tax=Actinotignum urinale TaxID=190146 RepID=A0ABU5G899_9ACTO|nr:antitoxin VbhA family protein [Actinotignum urinale]MDY5133537.1 antitoxin VbhA family protein [Actinotignum urinale]MDY5160968.1 antitoxin VbhA family protein [Actinotignum urinale]WIK59362.1 antitoxin VbhA family protein [Actinotignum urinale]